MDLQQFLEGWRNPPPEYGLQPFWFWNGDLEPAELVRQIGLMHEQGVTGFVIHARVGLTVPYLSEAWFDRVRIALEKARELGMIVWIYDEENWPSGYAGGRVLQKKPDLKPQNLSCQRVWLGDGENLSIDCTDAIAVNACRVGSTPIPKHPLSWHGPHAAQPVAWHDSSRNTLTFHGPILRIDGDWKNPGGRWLVTIHRRETTEWYPAYTDQYYVDVLRKETAPLFLETTHDEYWKRFPEFFGETIRGFFVDEPGVYNNFWDRNVGSIAWTEDFAEAFLAVKGYDLRDKLLALYERLDDSPQIRFDYYSFVSALMRERFMEPLTKWCKDHGVEHTGHVMLEEFMHTAARYHGNPFEQLAPLHVPGCDRIDEVYEKVTERIASSVAHLGGRKRVLSETYALIGWKLATQYMKEIFDYQAARGVNVLVPHAFYYSIDDFRKDECPPSEFFQNPWWPHFRPFADYVRRTSFALSQGRLEKDFLLYYPIDTMYTLISPDWPRASEAGPTEHWQLRDSWHPGVQHDQDFVKLCVRLDEAGLDYDLVDHTFLLRASVVDGRLQIGDVIVEKLVLPYVRYVPDSVRAKIEELVRDGVTVISFGGDLDIGEVVPPAPLALVGRLRKGDYQPITGNVRGPTLANPARDSRPIFGSGSTVFRRRLDDGSLIVFEASNLSLTSSKSTRSGPPGAIYLCDDRSVSAEPGTSRLYVIPGADASLDFEKPLVWSPIAALRWTVRFEEVEAQELKALVPWSSLGKPFFSGTATYSADFELLKEAFVDIRFSALETAEVKLDGVSIGVACFQPARLRTGAPVSQGRHKLEIIVANTLAGALEGKERVAGLLACQLFVS